MNIIIEHKNSKKAIRGAFNICGTGNDLESIARQILGALDYSRRELGGDHPFAYGWVTILANEPQPSIANTPPSEWE